MWTGGGFYRQTASRVGRVSQDMARSVTRCRLVLLSALFALIITSACGGGDDNDPAAAESMPAKLRIGVIPNIAPDQQRTKYEPFRDYMQRRLGTDVELFVATDYAGVVSALASKKLDVAYLGGLTYVQAEKQVELQPLVTEVDLETGSPRYLSAVVVKSGATYPSIADLVRGGGSFAFGDVSSTSGSLYPRAMLVEAGARCSSENLVSCPPLSKVTFTGGHDATAQAVLTGTAAAGGLELRILHRLEREGSVPKGALRILGSREVMGYPWVARAALGPSVRQALVEAFTAIEDPKLLDLLRAKGYVTVSAGDYDEVRRLATDLGLVRPAR